jgi:hypothetical protein
MPRPGAPGRDPGYSPVARVEGSEVVVECSLVG